MNDQTPPYSHADPGAADGVPGLVERAFRYRGDVTVHTDNGESVTGYLFNRNAAAGEPFAQLLETLTGREVSIPSRSIAQVRFTGRDAASASLHHLEAFHDRQEGLARTGPQPPNPQGETRGH